MSEVVGRLLPMFTLLLGQRQHIIVVGAVIVAWRRQENDCVNTGIRYPTVCLITEIYQDMLFSFHDADSSK
jgi:hypothetical protein